MLTAETVQDVKPGDVLTYWHDTVAMGAALCYARVVSIGGKREVITVQDERGEIHRVQRANFDRKLAAYEWRPVCFMDATHALEKIEKMTRGYDYLSRQGIVHAYAAAALGMPLTKEEQDVLKG